MTASQIIQCLFRGLIRSKVFVIQHRVPAATFALHDGPKTVAGLVGPIHLRCLCVLLLPGRLQRRGESRKVSGQRWLGDGDTSILSKRGH